MKTRVVPSSELSPESLLAKDYVMRKPRPATCRQALAQLLRALHMQHAAQSANIHQQVNIAMLDGYKALGSTQRDGPRPSGKKAKRGTSGRAR